MNKDVIYRCIMPFWVGEGENEFEVETGTKWFMTPSTPEGYDLALETIEDDYATQIWMDYSRLDKYFVMEASK